VEHGVLWVKVLHLLFVIAWFAGLFYLPRIYVNLAQAQHEETYACLLGMARRLYKFMSHLGALAILFGLWLYIGYGLGRDGAWIHAKLGLVMLLLAYNVYCGRVLKHFTQGTNTRKQRYYRWINEVPVVMLLLVLILVVVRPF